jgi:hypothetical protein
MGEEERPEQAEGAPAGEGPGDGVSEEELRARLEEQIRKVRVQDVLLESIGTILNLSARRIVKEDERDLEQAKVGIDATRALVGLLDEGPAQQVRNALSELQMLYAREAGGGAEEPGAEPETGGEQPPQGPPGAAPGGRPGLWTPPGT